MSTNLEKLLDAFDCRDSAQRRQIAELLQRAGVAHDSAPAQAPQAGASNRPEFAMVKVNAIHTDPASYQFRIEGDVQTGVTERGRYAATSWNEALHGDPLILHKKLDGTLFVVDGHHRLELAKRLNALGTGPGEALPAYIYPETHYTTKEMKIIGAYKNIAHGKGDLLEAALALREGQAPDIRQELLPTLADKGNLPEARNLARLSPQAFAHVERREVPAGWAAQVAQRTPEPERQDAIMRILAEKHKASKQAAPVVRGA